MHYVVHYEFSIIFPGTGPMDFSIVTGYLHLKRKNGALHWNLDLEIQLYLFFDAIYNGFHPLQNVCLM